MDRESKRVEKIEIDGVREREREREREDKRQEEEDKERKWWS